MEDAATAEISRSQVWQWVVSAKGVLEDGRKVTRELVQSLIAEELPKVKTAAGVTAGASTYDEAAVIFEELSLAPTLADFLTTPLYERLD